MANGIRKDWLQRQVRKHCVTVAPGQVQDALQRQYGQRADTLEDRVYRAAAPWLVDKMLRYSGVDRYRYVPEFSDCGDFAYYLRGELPLKLQFNGVGVVLDYSSGHAYCLVLVWRDAGLRVDLVEPQTDAVVTAGDRLYRMERVAIHF